MLLEPENLSGRNVPGSTLAFGLQYWRRGNDHDRALLQSTRYNVRTKTPVAILALMIILVSQAPKRMAWLCKRV